jgi:hypothetical protein
MFDTFQAVHGHEHGPGPVRTQSTGPGHDRQGILFNDERTPGPAHVHDAFTKLDRALQVFNRLNPHKLPQALRRPFTVPLTHATNSTFLQAGPRGYPSRPKATGIVNDHACTTMLGQGMFPAREHPGRRPWLLKNGRKKQS